MKDPEGGNLDRIQIVKGWVDAGGARQEKVYDVAWSGDRKPGADGKLPAVGNTVDLATATYTNSIGAPELSAAWKDPEFDAALRAVYYVRVLEIPTPRWTAYDAVRFKVRMAKDVRMIAQARLHLADLVHAGVMEPDARGSRKRSGGLRSESKSQEFRLVSAASAGWWQKRSCVASHSLFLNEVI
jgi:hypothetical protein